jgi:hypothetical protein
VEKIEKEINTNNLVFYFILFYFILILEENIEWLGELLLVFLDLRFVI